MANPNDRQDDIVHVDSPTASGEKPPSGRTRETVRIQLPLPNDRDAVSAGPRTETARVSSVPVARAPEMKSPQALVPGRPFAVDNGLDPGTRAEKIPKVLPWILLGLSALILLIQIWTYLS
jgi:hypothetical protein